MKLVYPENKWFVGAVKFFDKSKDFGFIASNNCGMPLHRAYNQDFYVNSESFTDDDAKADGRIVVFQILEQRKGREKAVNVRRITKSDEDVQLILSYYGEHEKIDLKDNRTVNLYNHCYKPRDLVAKKVKDIILHDSDRSPSTTCRHVDFFLKHYKEEHSAKERFVFDRDFEKDEKKIWTDFFSIFTKEEWLEILKAYPSACRYASSSDLVETWVNKLDFGSVKDYLPTFRYSYALEESRNIYVRLNKHRDFSDILPEALKEHYLENFVQFIDKVITATVECVKENKPSLSNLDDSVKRLLRLTPNSHEEEINEAKNFIVKKDFLRACREYVLTPDSYRKEEVHKKFEAIEVSQQATSIEEAEIICGSFVEKCFENKKLATIAGMLTSFSFLREDFKRPIVERLFPLVNEELCGKIHEASEKGDGYPYDFIGTYRRLTVPMDDAQKDIIRTEIGRLIRNSNNFDLIVGGAEWISPKEVLSLTRPIMENMSITDISNFLNRYRVDGNPFNDGFVQIEDSAIGGELQRGICQRGFDLLKSCELPENLYILSNLVSLLPDGVNNPLCKEYLDTRSKSDLLTLYDRGLISSLPSFILEDVVNEISLDSLLAPHTRWYDKPILPDGPVKNIIVNAGDSLFYAITKRLNTLPLTEDNIPLAILLIELMQVNKSKDMEYWENRNWEKAFTAKLTSFRQNIADDSPLAVLLWAVYFQTRASNTVLTQVLFMLPPYIQIRVVKRLFRGIAQRKWKKSAEELYTIIGGDKHQICFPLEIVFAYLIRREKDPKTSLDNNIMLQLLDGREDHSEWIGIRQFVSACHGRIYIDDTSNDRQSWGRNFYNGIIQIGKNGKALVLVPSKMIDGSGELQNYNNKYFEQVKEWIYISFDETDYTCVETPKGLLYTFDEAKEKELYSLARYFKFDYKGVNSNIIFAVAEKEEDVFCECRMSDKLDNWHQLPFYWCGNKPCFCAPTRFHTSNEWEYYTMLDFMRILNIPVDYINQYGKKTRFGYYTILSAYLKSFAKFYEHLKCRHCGKLMKPEDGITNFESRAVNSFSCANEDCQAHGFVVYLNHCFNKSKCKAIIDSRDSKQCSNGQYICPECGACCSTENFRLRLNHLEMTGGYKSPRLVNFVNSNLGHWEKHEFYCYKCGSQMIDEGGTFKCPHCDTQYNHS